MIYSRDPLRLIGFPELRTQSFKGVLVELAEQITVRTYFVSVIVPFERLSAFAAACSIKSATSFG